MKHKKTVQAGVQILALIFFVFAMLKGLMVLWLALYGAGVLLSFFFGRFYCGYICPMNTAMTLSQKIKGKLTLTTLNSTLMRFLPFVSLLIAAGIMILGKKQLHMQIPVLLIYLGLSFVWTLFFSSAKWHTYLCPYSILLKAGGKKSRKHYRVEKETCIGCRKCVKVCPTSAITMVDKKAVIDPALCLSCGKCAEVCPTGAISYSL